MSVQLSVRKSLIHGEGLFADEPIKKGQFIMTWVDRVNVVNEEKYNKEQSNGNELYIKTGVHLVADQFMITDGTPRTEDKINHSFEPNVLYIMGHCFAIHDIKKDTELFVDYSYLLSCDDDDSFTCVVSGKRVIGIEKSSGLRSALSILQNILS
jgi:SET domain-containing protein